MHDMPLTDKTRKSLNPIVFLNIDPGGLKIMLLLKYML